MLWQIQSFPPCTHHIFLSHCAEDRGELVFPLFENLQRSSVIPWLDQHDYPYGRTSFEALRDGVLKSRHVVFLVTKAMLAQPRGWGIVELAWTELLQSNLVEPGGVLQNIILPLFFVKPTSSRLLRSVWRTISDRAPFYSNKDGDPIAWASHHVCEFVLREQQFGLDNALGLEQDSHARARLGTRPGLIERITARTPDPIPID